MRFFVISDLHVDYEENYQWLENISRFDYQDDLLLLGGDICDMAAQLGDVFRILKGSFKTVVAVPGNHDLWVTRNKMADSIACFREFNRIASDCGVRTTPLREGSVTVVPLLAWYDYSFGAPSGELSLVWADYYSCKWPNDMRDDDVTRYFTDLNEPYLSETNKTIISLSHFLPRLDLMPVYIPHRFRFAYPVLGTDILERQIRTLGSSIHVYGHSHVSMDIYKDNIRYVNNAFGYPHETRISNKDFACIYDS